MDTFQTIKDEGRLLYLAIGGSKSQGTNINTSDTDYFGIYIAKKEDLMGLPKLYTSEVSDDRHDIAWYEFGKFCEMLIKSNPTVLSMLFVDDKFIEYEHPIITELKKERQKFVTQDCFGAFIGYSIEQIKKARGLNKKIVQEPITKHLEPLDFCYTFYKQGSTSIKRWLAHRHLNQRYCGLVKIPNMHDTYGVYYDFGAHMNNESDWADDTKFIKFAIDYFNPNWFVRHSKYWAINYLIKIKEIGYRGIVGTNDDINIENFQGKPKIFDLRLSSIDDKDTKPICYITYNSSGYTDHCKKYKEYQEWVINRNPIRFQENKEKEFDRKNLAHCVRLLHMGIEIATTGEVRVNRENIDRDFILKIRLGETKYDEIMAYIEAKKDEMMKAMNESKLPKHINQEYVNQLLINLRTKFYNKQYQ